MKRLIFHRLLLILLGVLVLLSVAYAVEGPPPVSETVPVNALVKPYVKVTVLTFPMNFGTFTGAANEERGPADNAVFRVQTNADVNLTFSGGDLTHVSNPSYKIKTAYKAWSSAGVDLGWFNRNLPGYIPVGNLVVSPGQSAGTTVDYGVLGWAKTGEIWEQIGGDYSATITLTVWTP